MVKTVENVPASSAAKTASKPLQRPNVASGFSISSFLNQEEKTEVSGEPEAVKNTDIPQHHFTETDLQAEWNLLLKKLQVKDPFAFNAVKSFRLLKLDEKNIQILYPSDSAKAEFDKISLEFFNHFKTKVNNHAIEFHYKKDHENLKMEVITKKKIFEKLVEINPLLKDLDELMNFDLS